jgi:ABC-type multidrug transport system ATPase subunit
MSAAVHLRHVTKRFGRSQANDNSRISGRANYLAPLASLTAVEDITLSVESGEMFVLGGASKSGKSTLIYLLAGRLLPDYGEVRVLGLDPARQSPAIQRLVNRISGEASFFPRRSALENLAFYVGGSGRAQTEETLLGLGLEPWELAEPVSHLPRSRQQLIFLAHTLLPLPRLLLLDEPLRYLEAAQKAQVLGYLDDLRQTRGVTIVIATRHPEELSGFSHRTAMLSNGRLVSLHPAMPEMSPVYLDSALLP